MRNSPNNAAVELSASQRLAHLERALSSNGIGTWWARKDTREFVVDEKFREMTQLSQERYPRIFADDWAGVMHPEDRALFYRERDVLVLNQLHERYRRLNRADGTSIWVRVSIIVEHSDELGCAVVHGTLVDVSAEFEKRELERQRAVGMNLGLEAAGLLVLELNLGTGFGTVIAGHTDFPEFYLKQPLIEFWAEWTAGDTLPLILNAQQNPGTRVEYEVRNPHTDEHIHWMSIGFSEPFNRDGNRYQIAYRYVIEDYVRAREEAEQAADVAVATAGELLLHDQVLAMALEVTDTVVYELDIETQLCNVFSGNSQTGQMFTHTPLSEALRRIYSEADALKIESLLQNPGVTEICARLDPKTRERSNWSAITASRVYTRDGREYQLFVRQLVTDLVDARNTAQQQARELQKLVDEMNQNRTARDRMFAVIGHELRTPLAAMEMLLSEATDTLSADKELMLLDYTRHLLHILDDLRIVARPNELIQRERQSVRVEDEFRAIAATVQPLADAQGFSVDVDIDLPGELVLDLPTQSLRQLLVNLSKNALIHSGGDKLTLSVAGRIDGKQVELLVRVIDNGKGIPEHQVQNLFEPFVRGDTDADGTGLGLHICKEIANSLDASLHYKPSADGGSCFELKLALSASSASSPRESYQKTNLEGLKVLLLEDNLTLQLLTKAMLSKLGAEVLVAGDGQQGLDQLEGSDVDLIISDIFMPNLDGYGFAKEVRARGYIGPLIGLTAATIGDETDMMLDAGANCVLSKPISSQRLLDTLLEIG